MAALALVVAACGGSVTRLGILETNLGPDVDATRSAFLETLRDAGFRAADNLRVFRFNAESAEETDERLARHLAEQRRVDETLVLSPTALRAAIAEVKDRPILFAMVADPVSAGAGESLERHLPNVTGVVALPPVAEAVQTARVVLPDARRFAILFSPDEPASVVGRGRAVDEARRSGVELAEAPVRAAAEAGPAARQAIAGGAQALVLSPAKVLARSLDDILTVADGAGVPVFGWSEEQAQRGALAAVGLDYQDHGRRAGALMLRILKGERVADIPIEVETRTALWLNQRAAARLNIALPPALTARAAGVFS